MGNDMKRRIFCLILLLTLLCEISCGERDVSDSYVHSITWESVEVGTWKIDQHLMNVNIPLHYWNDRADTDRILSQNSRERRKIYGEDDRERIDPATYSDKEPYNAIVRISTGCSGILISSKHVLAASHCVHNGNNYLLSARLFLRAGYMMKDGRMKWVYVKRFFVPAKWRNHTLNGQHQYTNWADYDFSVLELSRELGDSRHFMKPGLSGLFCDGHKSLHGAGSTVDYVSFPDDKPKDAMWLVSTPISTETHQLLYFKGDAWHGSSGAALYTWEVTPDNQRERRVIGVLSGNRNTEPEAPVQGNYNVAVRLDPINYLMVCKWIGQEEECRGRYKKYLDNNKLQSLICNSH
jgi:serine protease 23